MKIFRSFADNAARHSYLEADLWNREPLSKDDQRRSAPPVVAAPSVAAPTVVTTPPPARAVEAERHPVALIGKSVLFRGDLISLEDMTIDGRVEGTIELRDHTLTIGRDATIQADITAKTVRIFGKVTGAITASETVDIAETGSVDGDITSRQLAMADGAALRGQVHTGTSGQQTVRPKQATTTN